MNFDTIFGEKRIEKEQVRLGRINWPEFMQHDPIVEKHWAHLYSEFLPFQFAAYAENVIAGIGNSVPVHFDESFINLPSRGLDWAMEKAFDDTTNNRIPDLLVGVQILINPELRDTGLSYRFLDLMKQTGITHGINHIALPLRPTQKQLYPLIEMEEYINWINQKGEPFDPWIRVHVKAGGKIVSICSESMTIRGTIKEWQEWTGLSFQSSGFYTIEDALSPINIDLEKGIGEYIEPNVWILHSVK
jgi:hypothetical protein